MKKLLIQLNDEVLGKEIALRLSQSCKNYEVQFLPIDTENVAEQPYDADEVILSEEELPEDFSFLPIGKLVAKLNGENYRPLESSIFIGFTGAFGGAGVTSCAVALGRIYSRLYGYRCLYLSLERYNKLPKASAVDSQRLLLQILSDTLPDGKLQEALVQDEYGLYSFASSCLLNPFCIENDQMLTRFLSYIGSRGNFQRVLLDIPGEYALQQQALGLCEHRILVYGPVTGQGPLSDRLKDLIPGCKTLHQFRDDDSFVHGDVDIHGQFGAEVRELAQELEGR